MYSHQLVDESINPSQCIYQLVHEINQPIHQSLNQPIGQSINLPINLTQTKPLYECTVGTCVTLGVQYLCNMIRA